MAIPIEFLAKTTGFGRFNRKITATALHVKRRMRDAMSMAGKKGGMLQGLFGKTAGTNLLIGIGMATNVLRQMSSVVVGLFDKLRAMATQFDQIAKSARRTGISFENFQKLTFAAQLTGATFENVERTFRTFQQRLLDLRLGNVTKLNSLVKDLKLDADALSKMNPLDAFTTVFGAINKVGSPNLKRGLAQAFGGRGGTQTLPLVENFKKIADIFQTLDLQIQEGALKGAEDLDDQFVILSLQIRKLVSEFGALEWSAQQLRKLNVVTMIARGKFGEETGLEAASSGGVLKEIVKGFALAGPADYFGKIIGHFTKDINKNLGNASEGLIGSLEGVMNKHQKKLDISAIEADSSFKQVRSTFNNMGGFATAGARALGTADPVVSELKSIREVLVNIRDLSVEGRTSKEMTEIITGHYSSMGKKVMWTGGNNNKS